VLGLLSVQSITADTSDGYFFFVNFDLEFVAIGEELISFEFESFLRTELLESTDLMAFPERAKLSRLLWLFVVLAPELPVFDEFKLVPESSLFAL